MGPQELDVVTGAFGYSGKYMASRLLDAGHRVRTLTDSLDRPNAFGGKVEAHAFNFGNPDKLVASLEGATALYNTYWVRFNHKDFGHAMAVDNTLTLFDAAKRAGIKRVIHLSITNPSEDSPLEYFRSKAKLERALIESGLSYAILRPTVLFGKEDILVNNIAWLLRHFPVFGIFGSGQYRLQPIYVDDLAKLAVVQGSSTANRIIDAIGPETFTYRGLVEAIGAVTGRRRPIISLPPALGYWLGWAIGRTVEDIIITREEIQGLMADLLYTTSPPAGSTKLTDWAQANSATLGRNYASELARRKNRLQAYGAL